MTRIGTTVFACSTAIALCVAGSASAATGGSEPKGFSEYMRLMKDGGSVTGGALLNKSNETGKFSARMISSGSAKLNQGCERVPLACGLYLSDDEAAFDAEQGPFSRALGNYEDYELSNPAAGSLCVVGNLPADCNTHPDPSGAFGCANGLDAGDVLKGIAHDQEPSRGGGAWEILALGSGFSGNSDKYLLPNYFGDTGDLTFPNAAVPVGCQITSPGPAVVGLHLHQPFGSQPGALVTITLKDNSKMEVTVPGIKADGTFLGICCAQEVVKVSSLDLDGLSIGYDDIKFGQVVTACPVTFPPLTLEDVNCGLESIEAKLDDFECANGGGCSVCVSELGALDPKVAHPLEVKRDAACRAKARGQEHTAENIMCAFLSHVDAQEGKSLTPAEAQSLRDCAASGDINVDACK